MASTVDCMNASECVWTLHAFDPGDGDLVTWWSAECQEKKGTPRSVGEFCSYCGKRVRQVRDTEVQ
jgi:hypothetical protein